MFGNVPPAPKPGETPPLYPPTSNTSFPRSPPFSHSASNIPHFPTRPATRSLNANKQPTRCPLYSNTRTIHCPFMNPFHQTATLLPITSPIHSSVLPPRHRRNPPPQWRSCASPSQKPHSPLKKRHRLPPAQTSPPPKQRRNLPPHRCNPSPLPFPKNRISTSKTKLHPPKPRTKSSTNKGATHCATLPKNRPTPTTHESRLTICQPPSFLLY